MKKLHGSPSQIPPPSIEQPISFLLQSRTIRSVAVATCSSDRRNPLWLIIPLVTPQAGLLAASDRTTAQSLEVRPSTPPLRHDDQVGAWNRANLAFGGWCLLTIAALLGLHRWRSVRQQQRRSLVESEEQVLQRKPVRDTKPALVRDLLDDRWPPGSPHRTTSSAETNPSEGGLDFQLLRFLSDGTAKGFGLQIDIYLKAFDSDRQAAHVIFAEGDAKKIHRIAHRLVAHAGTIHFVPLVDLATTIQSNAAVLTREQLDQLLRDIDREFANLKSILDGFRASIERA